jgi:vacuolar-type H+-ATPase subunit E/Vma4
MNKEPVSPMDHENADAICARIRQDTDAEVKQLSDRAQAQAQGILAQAKADAEAQKAALLRDLEKELEKSKERILSTLNLEKKRLVLEGKQSFVDKVLAEVKQKAARFRNDPAYSRFLAGAVVEGAQVLGTAPVIVYYSAADERIFDDAFIKKVSEQCQHALMKPCPFTLNKSEFQDLGVIVHSPDGRMMYDNRFTARLERMYDEIYMILMKEAV